MKSAVTSEWIDALQWHLRLLEKLYPANLIGDLLREARIERGSGGEVVTSGISELDEYISLVGKCLGPIAMVNARIQLSRRLKHSGRASSQEQASEASRLK